MGAAYRGRRLPLNIKHCHSRDMEIPELTRGVLLALERGVLSSALECTTRGHDQVHVPCIVLFKHESVVYCLMVKVVW